MDRFELTSEQNGLMMSYIGCVSILMQGAGIGLVTRLFTEAGAMAGATVVLTATYYLLVRNASQDCIPYLVASFFVTYASSMASEMRTCLLDCFTTTCTVGAS